MLKDSDLKDLLESNPEIASSFLSKFGTKKEKEEDADKPIGAQLTPQEMALTDQGHSTDYVPESTEKSTLEPKLSSSMYDTAGDIVSDAARMAQEKSKISEPMALDSSLAEKRTISAGEPTAGGVKKEARESELSKIIGGESARGISEYEDLMRRYQETQDRANQMRMMAGIGEGAELLGASIAGVKPADASFYRQMAEQAGLLPKQFKEGEDFKKEARRSDPASDESKSARALLKEQGITVPDSVSAAFIEKQYPQFSSILRARELAQQRKEAAAERKEEREFALKTREQHLDDDFIASGLKQLTSDKTYATRQKVLRGKELIKEAVKNPSAFGDVASLYTAITALDPDSVVREGEIKLSREGMSLGESIQRQVSKIGANPRLINDRLLKDIEKYVSLIDKQTEETYNLKRDALFQQAENRGIKQERYKAMDPFSLKKQIPESSSVVVEKEGKKYSLPKEQLSRAIKQGYKEVK